MGFTMPHITILIGAGVIGLALLLQIVGLATPAWKTWKLLGVNFEYGLWKFCDDRLDSCSKHKDLKDWQKACQAFGILAVLTIVASLVCAVLTCFMAGKKIIPLLASIAAAVGAFCILIEFAVFAGENNLDNTDYGYSFGLTIVACILCIVATVCFFLGSSKTMQ